ncbi:YvrJ protein family protein [Ignavigranum ruoffiae]|uniref:YvrJ protein family protein n=1 Tax=Ignavigranum ruoffiae TaxID=89093 RepID=A0A1H9GKT4_9LACT|nr:YvrJ family protein [Ignavigranum ruoffiae]SEQ50680.1 YvrJ protein family protein [Ignavigranum ruoffiae]
MEEVINLIANFGFPIALVIYFLARFEKKLEELSTLLTHLSWVIEQISDTNKVKERRRIGK